MARRLVRFGKFCKENQINVANAYHATRVDEFPGLHRVGRLLFVDPDAFFEESKASRPEPEGQPASELVTA